MIVKFSIPGEPYGKGRPRFRNAGTHQQPYTPAKTANYENLVKLAYTTESKNYRFPDDAMLDVRIFAFYAIPKSASKKKRQEMIDRKIRPTKKPDFDNIGKIVCDSLNQIAYKDDSQIVDAMVRKFYDEIPRVVVTIRDITEETE